jgi:transmembrane sensor
MDLSDADLYRQASVWLTALIGPNAHMQQLKPFFYAWFTRSSRHRSAFLRAVETFDDEGRLHRFTRIDIRRLLDEAPSEASSDDMPSTVILIRPRDLGEPPLREPAGSSAKNGEPSPHPTGRLAWIAGACAAVFLSVALLNPQFVSKDPTPYRTQTGERMTITLPDGSVAILNTDTRMEVGVFSGALREVRIISGEVLFRVAHDSQRPFRVFTPNTIVEDVGTQFDVYVHGAGATTTVSVTEGRVDAKCATEPGDDSQQPATQLAAGDVADISTVGETRLQVRRVSPLALKRKLSWTDGTLELVNEPLAEAAIEFNRYNRRQLVVRPDVQQMRVSGVFMATDPDNFVKAVNKAWAGKRERSGKAEDDAKVIWLKESP